jgi:OOP family OmpA-OmpF porin
MKSAKALGAAFLAGFAAMSSQSAVALDSGWYAGLGVGLSMTEIDNDRIKAGLLQQGLTTTSISDDERDVGYKIFGGYKINRHFAVEGGYFDLGKFSYTANTSPPGTVSGSIKLSGFNIDGLGILPLSEKFSAFGRIGVQYAKAKDSISGNTLASSAANESPSKSSTNYKAGVGVQYDFTETVGLRTEWERYRVNDAVGNRGDIDMVSVGLVVMFGGSKAAHTSRSDTPPPETHSAARDTPPPPPAAQPEHVVAAASPQPAAATEPVVTASPTVPVAAAAGAVLVVVPVPARTQTYCSILDIQFEINGDSVQRQDQEKIEKVGLFMQKYPETTATIEGHSDDVGAAADNMKLSQRRADSVVSYLVNHSGIAQSRLNAVGYGETRPITTSHTEAGRRLNRRTDAVIACATDVEGLKPIAKRITMAMEMEFDPNKADVKPQYREELRKVADFMKSHPGVTATVEGHTGNLQATPKLAMEISQLRAQNVMNYLVDNFGIARSRLTSEGFGQTRRFAYNTSKEGQQENRRVNIILDYPS